MGLEHENDISNDKGDAEIKAQVTQDLQVWTNWIATGGTSPGPMLTYLASFVAQVQADFRPLNLTSDWIHGLIITAARNFQPGHARDLRGYLRYEIESQLKWAEDLSKLEVARVRKESVELAIENKQLKDRVFELESRLRSADELIGLVQQEGPRVKVGGGPGTWFVEDEEDDPPDPIIGLP